MVGLTLNILGHKFSALIFEEVTKLYLVRFIGYYQNQPAFKIQPFLFIYLFYKTLRFICF